MALGFNDILKKGKKAVCENNPRTEWLEHIGAALNELDNINSMYNNGKHNIREIEKAKCNNCDAITYVIVLYDIDDKATIMKYHSGEWESTSDGIYTCPKCKTGNIVI